MICRVAGSISDRDKILQPTNLDPSIKTWSLSNDLEDTNASLVSSGMPYWILVISVKSCWVLVCSGMSWWVIGSLCEFCRSLLNDLADGNTSREPLSVLVSEFWWVVLLNSEFLVSFWDPGVKPWWVKMIPDKLCWFVMNPSKPKWYFLNPDKFWWVLSSSRSVKLNPDQIYWFLANSDDLNDPWWALFSRWWVVVSSGDL